MELFWGKIFKTCLGTAELLVVTVHFKKSSQNVEFIGNKVPVGVDQISPVDEQISYFVYLFIHFIK